MDICYILLITKINNSINIDFTLILAVWGMILSTILALLRLIDIKRRLKVSLGINQSTQPNMPHGFDTVISLNCTNYGNKPITIENLGVEFPNGISVYVEDANPYFPVYPPKKLEYGDTFGLFNWGSTLHQTFQIAIMASPQKFVYKIKNFIEKKGNVVKIRGYFRDTLGKKYWSKKVKIDLDSLF